ncbi:phage portal protein [Burkholderia vietnamiensis]|uniref:phage portal protein n=1 Tax=Burkholderia vietnamiensis TaxID=60552 RepID=UPI00112957D5|nr:phage portal protein [Burkholderia vietnamiensis]MDN8038561.1 phage portal protein [Burkholderia vietnamiensis]TPQ43352.1 phage portal protein [Burkholderia ubonensis]
MFISRIKADGGDRSPWGGFWFEPVSTRTTSGMRVSPDRALQLPVVFSCVRVLAESFAVLPMRMYRVGADGKKTPVRKHWLIDLLCRRPNKWQTPFEWREMMQGHLALRGNAFNQIVADRRGNITDLVPLHPDRIKIELLSQSNDFDYRYRYTDRFGNETVFTREELWHIRGLSSDGILGMNPIELAREAVGLGLSAQEYGARFFQNDAKPGGGWIEFPGSFKDKATRDTFRESFQAAQTGLNRGKIAVLEHGMKFHEIGLTNKDSQFLEARQYQVGDIARMFRIPPHLVGDLSKATFSNIEQQSLDFVIYTMTPWAERWESSIETNLLLSDDADIEVEFDFTGLLRGDQAARSMFYHNGILDGWMTRNQARESENMEPIDGLDEPLMPLNMVPVSDAAEARAAAQPTRGATPPDGQNDPQDAGDE